MEKCTLNNIAILKPIELDPITTIELEWDRQVAFNRGFNYDLRNYVEFDFFTLYFKNLIKNITTIVGLYKNILLQIHDKKLIDAKWYLSTIHKDAERLSCITIPLLYNMNEPVNFYGLDELPRGASPNRKPTQRLNYSRKHPNLVNVNNYHNVRLLDDLSPRVLLQLSYDKHFDEIVYKNPDYWEIM